MMSNIKNAVIYYSILYIRNVTKHTKLSNPFAVDR